MKIPPKQWNPRNPSPFPTFFWLHPCAIIMSSEILDSTHNGIIHASMCPLLRVNYLQAYGRYQALNGIRERLELHSESDIPKSELKYSQTVQYKCVRYCERHNGRHWAWRRGIWDKGSCLRNELFSEAFLENEQQENFTPACLLKTVSLLTAIGPIDHGLAVMMAVFPYLYVIAVMAITVVIATLMCCDVEASVMLLPFVLLLLRLIQRLVVEMIIWYWCTIV